MASAARPSANVAKAFASIPGPRALPIVGSCLQYRVPGNHGKEQYHLALNDLHKKYGPLVREVIGQKIIVHVFNPEDIQTVYSVEGKWPVIPPLQETTAMYRQQKDMSLGLGNTNGEEWYRLRSNCQQRMLRPREVAQHLPSVNVIADEMVHRLQGLRDSSGEVADLRTEVGRWSLENAASLVFDKRLNWDQAWGEMMVSANADIFRLSGDLKLSLPLYKALPSLSPKWKQLIRSEDQFYSSAIKLTDEAILSLKKAVEENQLKDDQFYFLSYLLSRPALSLKDVTVICLSLFTDGLSTTTPTILFNLYCLATWPAVQQRVYDEIVEQVSVDQPITADTLARLPYLKAFVKETFRLWPNGTEVSRYCEQDLVLSGYEIPTGTHLDLNPSVHFRDPSLFPDPHTHMPERWLRGGSGSQVHPYILTPFGHGTRMCAGRRFAEQDLYVLLAKILRRFKLSHPSPTEMGQTYHTLLWPDRRLRVVFEDRD